MMTQVDGIAQNLCSVSLSTLSPVGGVLVTQAWLSNQALQETCQSDVMQGSSGLPHSVSILQRSWQHRFPVLR